MQKHGALQGVQLKQNGSDLGEERVGENIVPNIPAISEQFSQMNLERVGQSLQGRQRWHGASVLDFGDIGAWHLHPAGELALAEVAATTQLAHGTSHLRAAGLLSRCRDEHGAGRGSNGRLDFERLFAATADRAGCAELNETAMVAA